MREGQFWATLIERSDEEGSLRRAHEERDRVRCGRMETEDGGGNRHLLATIERNLVKL